MMARTPTRRFIIYPLFFLLAAGLSLASSRFIFLNGPITSDENSYLFQAHVFLDGRLKRPLPPLPEMFEHEMIILDREVGWLSRYPPGHPLWLTPGAALDRPDIMTALAAGLGAVAVMAAAALLGASPWMTGLLLMLSPFFLFMNGTWLSHTSGFLFSAVAVWSFIRWHIKQRRGAAMCTGLAFGVLFNIRPYTAVLTAFPFMLFILYRMIRFRDRHYVRDALCAGAAGAVLLGLSLLYNYIEMGELASPYLYYEPSEGLGFGIRRARGWAVHHTFARGLRHFLGNIRLLDRWLWGAPGGLAAVAVLALAVRPWRWTLLLSLSAVAVYAGYIFFWYPGITDVGPVYYFETLPVVVILTAVGLQRMRQGIGRKKALSAFLPAAVFGLLAVSSIRFTAARIPPIRRIQMKCAAIRNAAKAAPENALIVPVDIPESVRDRAVCNVRGLKSDPLFVKHRPRQVQTVARCFPERKPFFLMCGEDGRLEPIEVEDLLTISIDACKTIARTGHNMQPRREGACRRAAWEQQDREDFLSYGAYTYICPGLFRVIFDCSFSNAVPAEPVRLDVMKGKGERFLAHRYLRHNMDTQIVLNVRAATPMKIEPRVYYGGKGDFILRGIRIEEVPDT